MTCGLRLEACTRRLQLREPPPTRHAPCRAQTPYQRVSSRDRARSNPVGHGQSNAQRSVDLPREARRRFAPGPSCDWSRRRVASPPHALSFIDFIWCARRSLADPAPCDSDVENDTRRAGCGKSACVVRRAGAGRPDSGRVGQSSALPGNCFSQTRTGRGKAWVVNISVLLAGRPASGPVPRLHTPKSNRASVRHSAKRN